MKITKLFTIICIYCYNIKIKCKSKGVAILFMKRFFIAISLIMIFLFSAVAVHGSVSRNYDITYANMRVSIPGDYYVVTRDSFVNDPFFEIMDTTHTEMMDTFAEQSIYLNAVSYDYSENTISSDPLTDITISVLENDFSEQIFNMNSISSEKISEIAEEFMSTDYENAGIEGLSFDNYSVTNAGVAKYLTFMGSIGDTDVYTHMTVVNAQQIVLVLRSVNDEITSDQILDLDSIVGSIKFNEIIETPNAEFSVDFMSMAIIISIVGIFLCIVVVLSMRSRRKWIEYTKNSDKNKDSAKDEDLKTVDNSDDIKKEIKYAETLNNDIKESGSVLESKFLPIKTVDTTDANFEKPQIIEQSSKSVNETSSDNVVKAEKKESISHEWETAQESHVDVDFLITMLELDRAQGIISDEEYEKQKKKLDRQ